MATSTTAKNISYGLISGLLLVLSLPKPDFYPLAWIALVPLLFAIAETESIAQLLATSYAAGLVFFSGGFYWITETMMIYGGLSAPSAAAVGALFALSFALYFVVFGLALHFAIRKFGPSGLLFASPLWVTVVVLRSILFSGFPGMLSVYALVPYAGILQMAAWTGVYGLSFLATAINSLIAYGLLQNHKGRAIPLGTAAAAIVVAWALPMFGV